MLHSISTLLSLFVKCVVEILDDGIREQFGAHLMKQGLSFFSIGFVEGNVEDLPHPNIPYARKSKRPQRLLNGLTLWIVYAAFQRDVDPGFHDRYTSLVRLTMFIVVAD